MLNGQKLTLSPDGELPILSPKIRGSHQLITVPAQCVFFIVLPDSKSKACTTVQIEEPKELYKNGGKIVALDEFDDTDYETPVFDQEEELVSNEKNNYVTFRHKYTAPNDKSVVQRNERQETSKTGNDETAEENNEQEPRNNENAQQPEPIVKYVTFSNNNNWLSKFPKSLNNQEYTVEPSTCSPTEATTAVEAQTERGVTAAQSRREKYHILAQAVVGKRYPEKNVRSDVLYPNLDSAVDSIRASQRLKLIKRSIDDLSSKEINEMLEQFTNKEKPRSNAIVNTADETSSAVPIKSNERQTNVPGHQQQIVTQIIHSAIANIQQTTVPMETPEQTTTMSATTAEMSAAAAAAVTKQQTEKAESHIQKIKTRAEQALGRVTKLNEKTSRKLKGKRLQEKLKEKATNPMGYEESTSAASVTEVNAAKTKPAFVEKVRHNRQTNYTTTTESDLKTVRPRVTIVKSKKPEKLAGIETVKASSFLVTEPTGFEICDTDGSTASGGIKLRNLAKTLKSARARIGTPNDEKTSVTREVRDTTQQPAGTRLKTRPMLAKVKTPPNVDAVQLVTNEKITEKLVENLRDGKKTLQSERATETACPSDDDDKNDDNENTLQGTKSAGALTANARIKALEARIKARRAEAERRLHNRIHKIGKRSPTNNIIVKDDVTEYANGILQNGGGDDDDDDEDDDNDDDKFVASHIVEVVARPVLKGGERRYARSVADFTVKLNEVNTYVDKMRKYPDPRNNEIIGADDDGVSLTKGWSNVNDFRLPAVDYDNDGSDAKSKRKSSVHKSVPPEEDDFGGKTTGNAMNKLLSQMHKIWMLLKRTFLF